MRPRPHFFVHLLNYFRPNNMRKTRMMIQAPAIATSSPSQLIASSPFLAINSNSQPPSKAPAIPRRILRIKEPELFMIIPATHPATAPTRIHRRMFKSTFSPFLPQLNFYCLAAAAILGNTSIIVNRSGHQIASVNSIVTSLWVRLTMDNIGVCFRLVRLRLGFDSQQMHRYTHTDYTQQYIYPYSPQYDHGYSEGYPERGNAFYFP